MNDFHTRIILFLGLCIPIRLLFVLKTYYANKETLKMYSYAALIPVLGFMYIYATNSRKSGVETMGKPIWWNNLRPIHSILYLMFVLMANSNNKFKHAYIPLLIDVIIGLFSFLKYHKILSS